MAQETAPRGAGGVVTENNGRTAADGSYRRPAHSSTARAWAAGGVIFGAVMMVVLGIWQVIVGIAAIADDDLFVVGSEYLYELDLTAWGWIHVGIGALVTLVGIALFTGSTWARVAGIVLASLTALSNFFYLPYYPIWSIVVIALAVFVVWSLASAESRDLT